MKRSMVWLGLVISLSFLTVVVVRMDWEIFWASLIRIEPVWLLAAAAIAAFDLALRSLRWNIISGCPPAQFGHFWRAAAIGQLCNFIYPLRAGEVIRVVTLNQYAGVPFGQATTSAVVDRINDGLLLIVLLVVVVVVHGAEVVGFSLIAGVLGVFGVMTLLAVVFVIWGGRALPAVSAMAAKFPGPWPKRLYDSYLSALEISRAFRRRRRLSAMVILNGAIMLGDFTVTWLLIQALGWSLPWMAAITVIVFLWAGGSLPSAPGFIGIYQVACVLAFALYDIDESAAVAYSVILQLVVLCAAIVQGTVAALSYGTSLRVGRLNKEPMAASPSAKPPT